jgi:hypothetical protein
MLRHCNRPRERRDANQGIRLPGVMPGATISGDVTMGFAMRPLVWCKRTGVSDLMTQLDPSTCPAAPRVFSESP